MTEHGTDWMNTPEILSVVFHPRSEVGRTTEGDYTNLAIPVDDDVVLGGRFYEAGKDRPTILFFHGNADFVIPKADAHALMAASPSASKRLLTIDGAGHNDLLCRGLQEYMAAVAELVGKADDG